jgi:hypothetical protein
MTLLEKLSRDRAACGVIVRTQTALEGRSTQSRVDLQGIYSGQAVELGVRARTLPGTVTAEVQAEVET